MLYPSLDPNEQFRARREQVRRRKRRRRALVFAVALLAVLALAAGMTRAGKGDVKTKASTTPTAISRVGNGVGVPAAFRPRSLPVEVRGVHVTGPLASRPGKLAEYASLTKVGLNTIQLDVKDEGGEIGFRPVGVPLATRVGAVRRYYNPRAVVRMLHARGVYVIGRVVVFQDPVLTRARPDLAIHRPDGSVWTTSAGLGWLNPYDRRNWDYAVGVASAAARAGFDEIMLDYVRFPSDGDVSAAVYPGRTSVPKGEVIADFSAYAQRRLAPLGVRISTALFGLSATRDLRIGQVPAWISQHVDHVNPMAYPMLYGGGELGIDDPSSQPGETVFRTLVDFKQQLKGSRAQLIPWIQDWNYSPKQLRQQIEATRLQGAKGYLLWNARGIYTKGALTPPKTP
jgi:hypothetical protein